MAPAELWSKLTERFALIGVQGIVRMAMAGFDIACWDALAVAANMPLVRLLGGEPRRIPAYNSCGLGLMPKDALANEAEQLLGRGFRAIKLRLGYPTLKEDIAALGDKRIIMPGYVRSRAELARWLASADIYVSGMADETFGVSIVEAQASGLPVVGVAAGAMIDRVTQATGRLGPVGDAEAMAANILQIWTPDRHRMSELARAHALEFGWERSMETLFGRVYPAAFARRAERLPAVPNAVAPLVQA